MISGPPDLPEELVSLDDVHIELDSGRQVAVRRYRAHLNACPEKPPIALDRAYSAKPLVLVEKQVAFPEIAVLALFKKMRWEGAWVDVQHHKFFDRMPNQSKGMSLGAHANRAITRIAAYNDNSRVGCWDLVLWAERAVAFAAVVGCAPGARGGAQRPEGGAPGAEIGEARTRWLAAAVKSGLSASQFVVVEWDYRRVVVRRKRSG
ncbi:MAG: hypothetical protein ABSG85_09270 [Spirochaetia bacterium]|jgi:hypothetical protein